MPYITKNTFFNLVKDIDLRKEPPPSKLRLEGKDLTILSKKERQRLAIISEILSSENIEIDRFFVKIENPIDTLNYVFPEKSPSYHSDINCKALTREYENYKIPEEIRIQGEDSVKKFRKFFSENKNFFKTDYTNFLYLARKEFNLKRLPEDILEIKSPNSGRGIIEDFDFSKLEESLDKAIKNAEDFKNLNPMNRLTINMYGNLFFVDKVIGKDEQEIKTKIEILNKWSDLKKALKKNYEKYCMIKHNSNFDLSGSFLNALGLKPCSYCQNNDKIIEFI